MIANAINAAVNDPRFNKVSVSELGDIEAEVSVLTVPETAEYSDPSELRTILRPEVDGVILSSGFHSATFLPQVWEQLPEYDDFMGRLCLKAGLAQDCYTKDGIKVERYQAQVFSESEHGLIE